MTYFYLFSIAILAGVALLSAIRVGVLEERIAILHQDVRYLAIAVDKKSRLYQSKPSTIELWHNVRDYADGEVDYD